MRSVSQVNSSTSWSTILSEKRSKQNTISQASKTANTDTLTISNTAQKTTSTSNSVNTSLDSTIDLQSYIDETNAKNQESIENAGDSIVARNSYCSVGKAYQAALNEKYTTLVETAKQSDDPNGYVYRKYNDKNCAWYESDLSDEERSAGYRNEMDVLNTGAVYGINMQDSLFRNLEESSGSSTDSETSFDREMINAQISNILEANDITVSSDSVLSFSVDPYSYQITVSGADDDLQEQIEQALNVGENGKNLYFHIITCATTHDGVESTQVTDDGMEKYQLYHQVEKLTGIDISTLTEKDGSYYTEDGENILDIVNQAIDESSDISGEFKGYYKESISQRVSDISSKGWDNISDMVLQIDYEDGELQDKYQNFQY